MEKVKDSHENKADYQHPSNDMDDSYEDEIDSEYRDQDIVPNVKEDIQKSSEIEKMMNHCSQATLTETLMENLNVIFVNIRLDIK